MKSKLIFLTLCCGVVICSSINANAFIPMPNLDVYCPNPKKVCVAIHKEIVDPRKVIYDAMSMGGQTVENAEQIVETLEAGLQLAEKTKKMKKWAKTGKDIKRALRAFKMPEMKDFVKGTEATVDVYKGKVKGMIGSIVDFENEKKVSDAIMNAVVVSNPITAAERKAEDERKAAFLQQSALDIVARTLFYKSELNQLKDTLAEMQSASGEKDTVGVHEISIQMKEANQRIQALEEKILASRLELQSLKNLKSAKPVEQKIDVSK